MPSRCCAQLTQANIDKEFFLILPSSMTVHIHDAPKWLKLLDQYVRKTHPSLWNPKTTFRWSSTIGHLEQNEGGENRFSPGRLPGHGQIVVENSQTKGKAVIEVAVLPLDGADARFGRRVDMQPGGHDLLFIFPALCEAVRSPCGIEYAKVSPIKKPRPNLQGVAPKDRLDEIARHENRRIDVAFQHVRPQTVLDAISTQSPDYRWLRQGGVIDLIPKPGKGWETKGDSILDRQFKGPLSMPGTTASKAMELLMEAVGREMGINISSAHAALGPAAPSPGLERPEPTISITLSNCVLRECLNEIARADGQAIWHFGPLLPSGYAYRLSRWGRN